jgi:hypothetical protein
VLSAQRAKRLSMLRKTGLAILCLAVLAGCESDDEYPGMHVDPQSVLHSPAPWPTAQVAAPDAPPKILAIWLNSTDVVPGKEWRGRIAAGTNVASVEVRTESFSFNATRTSFGEFAFDQHVLDIVPHYKRAYTLHVVARNSRGDMAVREIPIVLR